MRGQRALWIKVSPCASAVRGINGRTRRSRAMTHKCQCQNMHMQMNVTQCRNLQSLTDPRDRGSSASIARQRKFSVLPMKSAMTLCCRSNYLHRIYESSHPNLTL
eukprot:6212220-Pleurochrysis_carterae.AAC.1